MSASNSLSGSHAPLWHGRFVSAPSADALSFETSIRLDSRMAIDDIQGSVAHARMLGLRNIIPLGEAEQIISELNRIAEELTSGTLKIDENAEDIHSFIEAVLTDRLGDVGRKLHAGRSRNDQIALDERLYLRRALSELQALLLALIETLAKIAERNIDSLMPGYTHMQRAQPVTLAHHMLAWCMPLKRDYERLADALKRMDYSPLGSGALAASDLPLDRDNVKESLGFSNLTENSLDAVSDRDYCVETVSALALIMTHLSRYCEEIALWSSEEFKFIDLSESWSTGSSIMPQKKNPDFAELIRGRAGLVYGNLVALLTMLKGLPLSYNRDMQEDKTSLFAAYDTVTSCLRVFTEMISSASWNIERMENACLKGYCNATDFADYLVARGAPFRKAHAIAASAVRLCIQKGRALEELPLEELRRLADPVEINEDVFGRLTPQACVAARDIPGGPAPNQTRKALNELSLWIADTRNSALELNQNGAP